MRKHSDVSANEEVQLFIIAVSKTASFKPDTLCLASYVSSVPADRRLHRDLATENILAQGSSTE